MRPVTVAALLLSPRLSDLSPHADCVPQPSRSQEGAQGLPYCVERGNEKVQLLETIGKEKESRTKSTGAYHGNRAQMERNGPRFGNLGYDFLTRPAPLDRPDSSLIALYSVHIRVSHSTSFLGACWTLER